MIEYTVRVYDYGTKKWYLNGERHREDGPAVECSSGDKYWYLNDKLHREDGPALEFDNGDKSWYLNGKSLTEDEFNKAMSPTKELTISEIEAMLGYKIKVVGEDK